MKGRFSAAIISSFGLHALFVLALIFMWQARPFKIEPPAITVDIVTDANSDAMISAIETIADSKIDSGNPDGNNIPLPPPPAEATTEPLPTQNTPPQPAQPVAKTMPQPTPSPLITKQSPSSPTQLQRAATPANNTKPVTKATSVPKPNSTPFGAEFDLSAAMKSASGVDAKGRKAPNLGSTSSSTTTSGGELSTDLRAKIMSQMKHCWAEPDGGAASVTVVVSIKFNPNGSVTSTKLISPSGIGANTPQKIAIDNALKAIRDCSPFNLPANRYNEWGSIEKMRFNPKQLK